MSQPFLAWIVPVSPGQPAHPIAPGGVDPGYGVPAPPDMIWGGRPPPGYPAHPIAPGGRPPPVDPGYGYPERPVDPGYGVDAGRPHPEHPIVLPPVEPGGPPVEIWPKPLPHPEHPIVLPPPPTEGLQPDGSKPPPADGGWGYHPVFGWGYFPGPTQPGPK